MACYFMGNSSNNKNRTTLIMKICNKCKIPKSKNLFYKSKYTKDFIRSVCKECDKIYREKNKSDISKRKRIKYDENKHLISEKRKLDRIKNKKILDEERNYRLKNKNRINANYRKNYSKYREKILKNKRTYQKNNKEKLSEKYKRYRNTFEGKIIIRTHNINRKKKIKSVSDGTVKPKFIKELMNSQLEKCKICEINIKDNFHIDHIMPLCRGGLHAITNVQLLCPTCNLTKSTKTHEEYINTLQKIELN